MTSDLKDGKVWDRGKEEDKMFHKLNVLGMNDNFSSRQWTKVCGVDDHELEQSSFLFMDTL